MQYLSNSPAETKKIAEKFAREILKEAFPKKSIVIGLIGDLGGGKTTFLKGFARWLGIKEKILSPTFLIIKKFKIKDLKFRNFYHIDCYRIKKPEEILNLDLRKIIQEPKNIIAIEWAEKIKKFLPKETIFLEFQFKNQKKRKIKIKQWGKKDS